ncbi:hypothetical protein NPIL_610891 [Nephila pilipes]|uniref:Uncharacterized protein n=1 Tax=Nephila pilipes TaxID=299642 RepID=A0A8X6UUA8_NEPPI|nr:hypothetical protein NPIL_610891 [Nephila pilipes]
MYTSFVLHKKGAGRSRTRDENVEQVRGAFLLSPIKYVRLAERQLKISRSTVHMMLHKWLRVYIYKVQLLQVLLSTDKLKRAEFAIEMLHRIHEDS